MASLGGARAECRRAARVSESSPDPVPVDVDVARLLDLQRTAGNQAVTRMLTPGGRQVQRLIATENDPQILHVPDTVDLQGEGGRIAATLKSLLPGPGYSIKKYALQDFRRLVAFQDATWKGDYTSWAEANLGKGLDPTERTPPTADYSATDIDAAKDADVTAQFQNTMKVFKYSRPDMIQWGEPDIGTSLLLDPRHMGERSDPLPDVATGTSACVVQALNSIGRAVPESTETSVKAWHDYCRDEVPQIDYRTDNQIAKLYVEKLGFSLVLNEVRAWTDIAWQELGGDGTYLASSFPYGPPAGSAVGHMIAAIVRNGEPDTIHDQQGLTEPQLQKQNHNVHVRYVYRVP